ncbi:MAG TPA: cupin domain-containing protein [Candidatus Brocadiia bacterium]|nr:cupin domain-containing protein [Candidatus Brocadiales bacterium]
MINKIILYAIILTIVSGCGFVEEIKHPSAFPKRYLSSYQSVDKIIKDVPLAEGENLRITDVAETRTSIVRLVQVRKGTEINAHLHEDHDEIVYQVVGSGIAVLGGNQYPIKPSIVLLIPRGTPHSFINNGGEDSIALTFFSPPLKGSTNKSKAVLPIIWNLNDISEEIPPKEDSKTIELGRCQDASLQLTLVREGAEMRLHYHKRNDEVICTVKGSGIIILDGTRDVAKPGSIMIVPRKSQHKFINTGGETYVALSLFSPPFTGRGTKYIKEKKKKEKAPVARPVEERLRE